MNYENVFWYMDTKEAKNSVNLSEIEIVILLDLMIELSIMLNKVSSHDLESSTEKFHIIFTYKKWLQLYFFLQTIFFSYP